MVARVRARRGARKLVHRAAGQAKLGVEARAVFDPVRGQVREQRVEPLKRRVAEGEQDEDRGSGEALVLDVGRGRLLGGGRLGGVRYALVRFKDFAADSVQISVRCKGTACRRT